MATAEYLERFSKLPRQQKLLAFVLVAAFFGAIFYFVFYSDLSGAESNLTGQITQLEAEKADYENKKRQYLAFRSEVNKLLEKQKDLVKVLPTASEIHSLLRSIHAQGELAGLNILAFEQRPEVKEHYYARIPVSMIISGTFHQITRFFYAVGQLKRIVNIQDLSLSKPEETDRGIILKASFVASTFRFLTPATAAAPKG